MTTFLDVLRSRRSVRYFEDTPIPAEILTRILEAATFAPNAHNRQSWRFVVLEDGDKRAELVGVMSVNYRTALLAEGMPEERIERRMASRAERILKAPGVVIVCVDTSVLDSYDDPDRHQGEIMMAVQSAVMAGDHLLLAAHAEGLGGVWMCAPLFVQKKVREVLALPESWEAQGLILLGYAADERSKKPRKLLKDVVVYR